MRKKPRAFEPRSTGGCRQQRERTADAVQLEKSSLATHLISLWSWGHLSPQQIQKMVQRMVADVELASKGKLDMQELHRLAKLGNEGALANNCSRDLLAMIPVPAMESAAKSFILPMKKHFNIKETIERQQEFLLPHAVFAEMYSHHHDAFESKIRGADGKMATFWSTMEGNPQFERHPVKDRQDFEQFAVPLSIHGDGSLSRG
jgi:hypothetical protein